MNPWRSAPYQGARRKRGYFEGWYFKQVSADRSEIWSIIPGIARGESRGEGYSFVQVIEGRRGRTWWFQYPLEDFAASARILDVRVGASRFSESGIELDLRGEEGSFRGELSFGPFLSPPSRPLSPGVMGPFSFVPFMECRHGLVSLYHDAIGGFESPGRRVEIGSAAAPGRGYAEKDWGSSMPRSWIWAQSNDFEAAGDSLMLSIARIPWLGSTFTGFLCSGSLGRRFLRMATYTGARVDLLRLEDESLSLLFSGGRETLEVDASRARGGMLRAPSRGLLSRRIAESVDARLRIRWHRAGSILFEGEARPSGLEIVGDAGALFDRGSGGRAGS
jgi:tocopherol cyclase